MKARTVAFALLAPLCAAAQQPRSGGTTLRGTVVAAGTGDPLPLSIVALRPGPTERFTDEHGAFAVSGLSPGRYRLLARQIGYTPADTSVLVGGDSEVRVQIKLRHLAIELPPVTIIASPCTKPGRPDSSDAALVALFGQLQEYARRVELLADSYPYRYRLERTIRTVSPRGDTLRPFIDTLRFSSGDDPPYDVGAVVRPGGGTPWRADLLVRTTALEEFANNKFVANHCFQLAGLDTIAGETLVRINFEPSTRLAWADMAGTAYLDSLTYELRYTETALTHPERTELTDVRTMTARTRFRNIAPGVPLQDSLVAITTYRFSRAVRIETQRLLEVHFRRQP